MNLIKTGTLLLSIVTTFYVKILNASDLHKSTQQTIQTTTNAANTNTALTPYCDPFASFKKSSLLGNMQRAAQMHTKYVKHYPNKCATINTATKIRFGNNPSSEDGGMWITPWPIKLLELSNTLKNMYESMESPSYIDIDIPQEYKEIFEKYFLGWHKELLQDSDTALHAKLNTLPKKELIKIAEILFRYYEIQKFKYVEDLLDNGAQTYLSTQYLNDKTLYGHTGTITAVAYSPDGKQIASASYDQTIKLWDASTGTLLHTLSGHAGKIVAVAYSPDGKQIASASYDATIKLWDASTGTLLHTLSGHPETITALAYSPDGKQIASASYSDTTIKLWDASTGTLLNTLSSGHTNLITALAYSPDGKQIASASYDKTIKLWDASTGTLLNTLSGHTDFVLSIAYNPSGKQIASMAESDDRAIKIWDTSTGTLLHTLNDSPSGKILFIAYSPDGKQIASISYIDHSGTEDTTIKLWDTTSGALLNRLNNPAGEETTSIAYSPNSKQLASTSNDYTIKLWDTSTGILLNTLNGHTAATRSVTYNPNGKQIASSSDDTTIKLWNAAPKPAHFTPAQIALLGLAMALHRAQPQQVKTLDNILATLPNTEKSYYQQAYNSLNSEQKKWIAPLIAEQ